MKPEPENGSWAIGVSNPLLEFMDERIKAHSFIHKNLHFAYEKADISLLKHINAKQNKICSDL